MVDHELIIRRLRAAASGLRPGDTLRISHWDSLELRMLTVPGLVQEGFTEVTAEEVVSAAQNGNFAPFGHVLSAVNVEIGDDAPNLICPQSYSPHSPFTRCWFSPDELDGQKAEFRWTSGQEVAGGIGTFRVRRITTTEKVVIHIDQTLATADPDRFVQRLIPLYQRHVDAIERHPNAGKGDPSNPPFRMRA